MFYGVERANKGEWWDLFCSLSCGTAMYDPADIDSFRSYIEFRDRTGCNLVKTPYNCFNCNGHLTLFPKGHTRNMIASDSRKIELLHEIALSQQSANSLKRTLADEPSALEDHTFSETLDLLILQAIDEQNGEGAERTKANLEYAIAELQRALQATNRCIDTQQQPAAR